MKKFKYFLWRDPYMGIGEGKTVCYINANSKEHAKERLIKEKGYKHDPHFIRGDVTQVFDFIQPEKIPVI